MTTVTISLPESLKEFVDRQLATRGYGNVVSISARCCAQLRRRRKTRAWRSCCWKAWRAETTLA